jgi:hypothetical protein
VGRRAGRRAGRGERLLAAPVRGDFEQVEPEGFIEERDGAITVEVHQVVHDAQSGAQISDSHVRHRYRIEDGLIARMDVLE